MERRKRGGDKGKEARGGERSRKEGRRSIMVLGHYTTTKAIGQEGSKQVNEQWHSMPQNTAGR